MVLPPPSSAAYKEIQNSYGSVEKGFVWCSRMILLHSVWKNESSGWLAVTRGLQHTEVHSPPNTRSLSRFIYLKVEPLTPLPNERLGRQGRRLTAMPLPSAHLKFTSIGLPDCGSLKRIQCCLHSRSFSSSPSLLTRPQSLFPRHYVSCPPFPASDKRQQIRRANPEGVGCFEGLVL